MIRRHHEVKLLLSLFTFSLSPQPFCPHQSTRFTLNATKSLSAVLWHQREPFTLNLKRTPTPTVTTTKPEGTKQSITLRRRVTHRIGNGETAKKKVSLTVLLNGSSQIPLEKGSTQRSRKQSEPQAVGSASFMKCGALTP